MPKREANHPLKEFKDWLEVNAQFPGHTKLYSFRDHYMRYYNPPEGARLLDAGGFLGATAIHYAQLGYEVTSIEASKTYVQQFRKNLKEKCTPEVARRIRVVNQLVEEFDELEAYDAASMTEVIQFCPEPILPVKVVYRALKPGGRAFLTTPVRQKRTARWDIPGDILLALMTEAGFTAKVAQWPSTDHMPQWLGYGFKGEWQSWPGALV